MKPLFKLGIGIAVFVIVVDQLTKIWAEADLVLHDPVAVFPGLNMTLAYNTGVAFSMFDDWGDFGRWLLSTLAIVVSIVLVVWLWRLNATEKLLAIALGFVLGGALGNVIDRVMYGHVIDFIHVYYQDWNYPAFNAADAAITLGAILLIWDALFAKHEKVDSDNKSK